MPFSSQPVLKIICLKKIHSAENDAFIYQNIYKPGKIV